MKLAPGEPERFVSGDLGPRCVDGDQPVTRLLQFDAVEFDRVTGVETLERDDCAIAVTPFAMAVTAAEAGTTGFRRARRPT